MFEKITVRGVPLPDELRRAVDRELAYLARHGTIISSKDLLSRLGLSSCNSRDGTIPALIYYYVNKCIGLKVFRSRNTKKNGLLKPCVGPRYLWHAGRLRRTLHRLGSQAETGTPRRVLAAMQE